MFPERFVMGKVLRLPAERVPRELAWVKGHADSAQPRASLGNTGTPASAIGKGETPPA